VMMCTDHRGQYEGDVLNHDITIKRYILQASHQKADARYLQPKVLQSLL